jgi:hypothetical protein
MSLRTSIPEGYELFSGRNRETARRAIAAAVERGFAEETVLTVYDGYYVPLGAEADVVETEPGTENQPPVEPAAPAPVTGEAVDDKVAPVVDDSWKVADLDDLIDARSLDVAKSLNKSDKIDAVRTALEAKGE